jgi:hypothetical protein
LIVLDNGLDFTTQTSVFPRQTPALKKEVCEDIRFARFRPAIGSMGSRASKGKVITCRSKKDKDVYQLGR